jgi:hypothetical protein
MVQENGVQFSVFSRSATAMRLLLYNRVTDREPAEIIEFDRETDRWGTSGASKCRASERGNCTTSKPADLGIPITDIASIRRHA